MSKTQLIKFFLAASLSTMAVAETEKPKEPTDDCEQALCEQVQQVFEGKGVVDEYETIIPDPRAFMTPSQMVDDKVRKLLGGKFVPSALWRWNCKNSRGVQK